MFLAATSMWVSTKIPGALNFTLFPSSVFIWIESYDENTPIAWVYNIKGKTI